MIETMHRVCPVCEINNDPGAPRKDSKNEWKIKDCLGCGFVYLETAPLYESLVKETAWEKTSEAEKIERTQREPLKELISEAIAPYC